MVMLVSLQQASDHLRRDTDDDDEDLVMKIEAASEGILNYLGSAAYFLNSSGDIDYDSAGTPLGVPRTIQQATLITLGVLYKDRDGNEFVNPQRVTTDTARTGSIILPRAVHFLLDPFRIPTIA